MNKSIETIRATRNNFLSLIENLSIEEINKIPDGFNNNVIWNFGHLIVSQQILCYKLSNIPLKIDDSYVAKYSKGTKPQSFLNELELEFLKELSLKLINDLEKDLENDIFKDFTPYKTSFGVELESVNDVVKYLSMHEGLHLGYAMALKRFLK